MPVIRFVKNKKSLKVEKGDNLMQALLRAGLPVASSCNGKGICSKCRIRISAGADGLAPESVLEVELKLRNQIGSDERISCQTSVTGNITVDTRYW